MFNRSKPLSHQQAVHSQSVGDLGSPTRGQQVAGSAQRTADVRPGAQGEPVRVEPPLRAREGPVVAGVERIDERDRKSVLRVPTFTPLAPLLGWLVAWGAIATATAILERVGVPTGVNLGIANGGLGDDGLWAGLWALVISAGAFVLGGYAAARIARVRGTRQAVLVWFLAMAATAADAVIDAFRDGSVGAVRLIGGVPFWSDTGLTGDAEAVLVLAVFAAASLLGAIVGGGLGQTANRIARTDNAVVVKS